MLLARHDFALRHATRVVLRDTVRVALASLPLLSCAPEASEHLDGQPSAVAVVDQAGRAIDARHPPERILSLVPSATEVLLALGEVDRLVGRTDFDTAAAIRALPSVGGGQEPNLEALVALDPDVVIRFAGTADPRTPLRLDALGIPHFAVRPERIEEVRSMIQDLGRLTHRESAADSLLAVIYRTIATVRESVAGRPRRHVAFLLDGTPAWAAGPDTFAGELIEIAGGRNVFDDLDRPWAPVSAEELVARRIDIVLTPEGSRPGGVPDGLAIRSVSALTQLPGPRLGQAAQEIARAIHPEVFE